MRTVIVAVLVAVVMSVSLVGCGGSSSTPTNTPPTTVKPATP